MLVRSLNVIFFSFCRTFTQVSATWPDTDVMREELDDLQVSFFYCFSLLGFTYELGFEKHDLVVAEELHTLLTYFTYRDIWRHVRNHGVFFIIYFNLFFKKLNLTILIIDFFGVHFRFF